MGAVNTVTFIDNNRRFVSTSDDKTIRMWEFGIQAQAKYIADPSMHAISSAVLAPNGKWWLGQSMDNQIVTYSGERGRRAGCPWWRRAAGAVAMPAVMVGCLAAWLACRSGGMGLAGWL